MHFCTLCLSLHPGRHRCRQPGEPRSAGARALTNALPISVKSGSSGLSRRTQQKRSVKPPQLPAGSMRAPGWRSASAAGTYLAAAAARLSHARCSRLAARLLSRGRQRRLPGTASGLVQAC